MIRFSLMVDGLVLGLAASPSTVTLSGDVSVPAISLGGSAALAQRASDPRYQQGNSACRDGAGRRC